jgi:hypothetical protein
MAAAPPLTSAADPTPSASFVAVASDPGHALREEVSLFSSVTGQVTRRLAVFGESFTNNGLALAPDRSAVYVTLIPRHSGHRSGLRLIRIDVATGRKTFVAEGEQPAVSNDGTQLAYGAAPHGLAVRDLKSGRTRTVGLVSQLGPAADLLASQVTWLADESDIAVVPQPPIQRAGGGRRRRGPAVFGACHFSHRRAVVVFVHVPPPPARLTARCVHMAGPAPSFARIAGDWTSPTSLLLANYGGRRAVLTRISPTGNVSPVLRLGDRLPVAIDRFGSHILYLAGHSPPALWKATIAGNHLADRRKLISRSAPDPAAW